MAKEKFYSKHTNAEIENILDTSDEAPIYLYYDRPNGVYRFFRDKARCDAWVAAYNDGSLADHPEIQAYEFTQSFTAPAPNTINVSSMTDNIYILSGSTGNVLSYGFQTVDGNGSRVPESINATYSFTSSSGTKVFSAIHNTDTSSEYTTVSVNIDDYLELGTNTITISLKGRSTSATKTVVATMHVVQLNLSTTFDISRSILPNTNFSVTYTVEGQSDKTVEFYIDGTLKATANVSSLESSATRTQVFNNVNGSLAPGKHTLQIRASMMAGNSQFYSNLLFYEFMITGVDITTTLIQATFPSTQSIFVGDLPGLSGEQYVSQTIVWAYYSSNVNKRTATVTWRLYTAAGVETTLATRNADVVEAETDKKPDPITFMPTETGDYQLQALVEGNVIAVYTIAVIVNTSGLIETTEGLTMKLSGLGRSNEEPSDTKYSWADRGYSCTFYNMPFNGNAGYMDDAVVFNNGATGIINNKPYAEEVAVHSNNGNVVEIDFETINVDDDNAVVFSIGSLSNGASLMITATKAILTSNLGKQIVKRFKTEERTKIAIITHPNSSDHTVYPCMMFMQCNGVLAPGVQYNQTDTFSIGKKSDTSSTIGMINLGNAAGKAGIKIYYLRTYNATYNEWQGLNNYIIDSGENIESLVKKNDIFQTGTTSTIDVSKLEAKVPLLKITGDISSLIATSSKVTIYAPCEYTDPEDHTRDFTGDRIRLSNAGQSTLGYHISPSMHMNFDKDGNVLYDRDGNVWTKNRWTFRAGNVPEKKVRLQANPMDSSCCHNAAFLRMVNAVYPNVNVNGSYVLRTPSQQYILNGSYASAMAAIHGGTAAQYSFPYTINYVPDSKPVVVVWRKNENTAYEMLGLYIFMEEKKANYANGMHSIYDKVTADGILDPFDFYSGSKGNRLWDNIGCAQMENLRNHKFTLFTDSTDWSTNITERQLAYEKEFPDDDDQTEEEILASWEEFGTEVVKPISATYKNQEAFDKIIFNIIDKWHIAAYYCLVLRQVCSDSLVRNLEWTRYEIGGKWIPKWWDVDMQCGLQQSGACDAEPMTDRTTTDESGEYILSGRTKSGESSWLWDALENNTEFKEAVITMDQALYNAGWYYDRIVEKQDGDIINKFSQALYNKDGNVKYLSSWLAGYDYLTMFQGDRTSHRHWFERTNYDYWDAKHAVGEYRSKVIYIRARGAKMGDDMYFVAGATSYFGYGQTQDIIQSGVYAIKGEEFTLSVLSESGLLGNDPLQIYAANKIESADFHKISKYIWGAIDLSSCYDAVTGTPLKKLILGVDKITMNTFDENTIYDDKGEVTSKDYRRVINYQTNISFAGIKSLTRLEYFDIQGMSGLTAVDLSGMTNLKYFYSAASGLTTFDPADGANFEIVELPDTISSMVMNGVNLTNSNNECAITFWHNPGNFDSLVGDIAQTSLPLSLLYLRLTGMGSDAGTQSLVHQWCKMLEANPTLKSQAQINYTNISWGLTTPLISIDDLLTLASLPSGNRTLTGYIKCDTSTEGGTNTGYTPEQMNILINAFGEDCFKLTNSTSGLCCDCNAEIIVISASGSNCTVAEDGAIQVLQGTTAQFAAAGFPLLAGDAAYRYMYYANGEYISGTTVSPIISLGANNSINWLTGAITTLESSEKSVDYNIHVVRSTGGEGDIILRVIPRTYPKSVSIDLVSGTGSYEKVSGQWTITGLGKYFFDATHLPSNYTGNIKTDNSGVWTMGGLDEQYGKSIAEFLEGRTAFDEYCLNLTKLPLEEINITFNYTSNWMNNAVITATPLTVAISAVIAEVLTSSVVSGNPTLFKVMVQFGLVHSAQYAYSSTELKSATGSIQFKNLLEAAGLDPATLTNVRSGLNPIYNVLQYLKNVTSFDFTECTGLTGDIDVSKCTLLRRLLLSWTDTSNVELSEGQNILRLELAHPTDLKIKNMPGISLSTPSIIDGHCTESYIKYNNARDDDGNFKAQSIYDTYPADLPSYYGTEVVPPVEIKKLLPDEYQEITYLGSTGSQWIDTGIVASKNTRWELSYEFISTSPSTQCQSGAGDSQDDKRFIIGLYNNNLYLGFGANVNTTIPLTYNKLYDIILDAKNSRYSINGDTYEKSTSLVSSVYSLCIFKRKYNGSSSYIHQARCHRSKLYEDDKLVQDLVPAYRISDNVPGMYDIVSKTFFVNAGKDTFTCGDITNTITEGSEPVPAIPIGVTSDGLSIDNVRNISNIEIAQDRTGAVAFLCTLQAARETGNLGIIRTIDKSKVIISGEYGKIGVDDAGEMSYISGDTYSTTLDEYTSPISGENNYSIRSIVGDDLVYRVLTPAEVRELLEKRNALAERIASQMGYNDLNLALEDCSTPKVDGTQTKLSVLKDGEETSRIVLESCEECIPLSKSIDGSISEAIGVIKINHRLNLLIHEYVGLKTLLSVV